MISAWWDAHELEFVIGTVAMAVLFVGWIVAMVVDVMRVRRRRRRKDGLL